MTSSDNIPIYAGKFGYDVVQQLRALDYNRFSRSGRFLDCQNDLHGAAGISYIGKNRCIMQYMIGEVVDFLLKRVVTDGT